MALSRIFGKYSPYRRGIIRGAGIGAAGGALWGAASDDTSVIGGAFMGAALGGAAGGGFALRGVRQRALRQSLIRDMGMSRSRASAFTPAQNIGPHLAANTNASNQVIYGSTPLEDAMNAQIRRNIPRIPGQPYPASRLPNWRMPPIATRRR